MSYWYVGVLKASKQDGIVNRFVGFIDCHVFPKYSVHNNNNNNNNNNNLLIQYKSKIDV